MGSEDRDLVGWKGEVVTAPAARIPIPYRCEQQFDITTARIGQELGGIEALDPTEALGRTVAWERANPPAAFEGIGLLDYEAEDALLAEIESGRGRGGL